MTDYPTRYYKKARKRVAAKKSFYWHLASYVIVIGFLFLINLITGSEPWVLFPMLGWGVGLAFHYVALFGVPFLGVLGPDWEKRQMEKELERLEYQGEFQNWLASRKRLDDELELDNPDDWKLKDYDELRHEEEF